MYRFVWIGLALVVMGAVGVASGEDGKKPTGEEKSAERATPTCAVCSTMAGSGECVCLFFKYLMYYDALGNPVYCYYGQLCTPAYGGTTSHVSSNGNLSLGGSCTPGGACNAPCHTPPFEKSAAPGHGHPADYVNPRIAGKAIQKIGWGAGFPKLDEQVDGYDIIHNPEDDIFIKLPVGGSDVRCVQLSLIQIKRTDPGKRYPSVYFGIGRECKFDAANAYKLVETNATQVELVIPEKANDKDPSETYAMVVRHGSVAYHVFLAEPVPIPGPTPAP